MLSFISSLLILQPTWLLIGSCKGTHPLLWEKQKTRDQRSHTVCQVATAHQALLGPCSHAVPPQPPHRRGTLSSCCAGRCPASGNLGDQLVRDAARPPASDLLALSTFFALGGASSPSCVPSTGCTRQRVSEGAEALRSISWRGKGGPP